MGGGDGGVRYTRGVRILWEGVRYPGGGGKFPGVGNLGWGVGWGRYPGVVGTWDTYTPVPTPSGSHQNTYGWQAGDTHPTGMLSCLEFSGLTK